MRSFVLPVVFVPKITALAVNVENSAVPSLKAEVAAPHEADACEHRNRAEKGPIPLGVGPLRSSHCAG